MDWLTVADMNFRSRNSLNFIWYLGFAVKTVIYGYVLLHIFRFLKRKIPRLLGFGPLRRDPNMRKLRRLVIFFHHNCNLLIYAIQLFMVKPFLVVFGIVSYHLWDIMHSLVNISMFDAPTLTLLKVIPLVTTLYYSFDIPM